jgi:ankyrin repeat protein
MAVLKHLLVLSTVAFARANAADELSDFSNNLATDLGPLLILLGDSITKQYLSESTSFLDYFIFAMAPIGVITATISVIRVTGHLYLRAFIGRAQEGDGAIEAELCTSTSRDVCEMFNRGGITRVLGRPKILELVIVPSSDVSKGLRLARQYFDNCLNSEAGDHNAWKLLNNCYPERKDHRTVSPFAPNPNLSLNIGIAKRHRRVFRAISAIGLILQAGVIVLAGVGVWILQWNLSAGTDSASRNYAPVMFIAGTVLLCAGMWSCAALIGESTHELRFERKQQDTPLKPRLLWVQPGPQVIGDQSFDPFAYIEREEDHLDVWTSSTKDMDVTFEFYTSLAVAVVIIGYIMQFIGLRGMKAWVSLAQLGITVVMSILRGCLRMQRLDRHANKLADMHDNVPGHELDWLSFEIARWWDLQQKGKSQQNEKPGRKEKPEPNSQAYWLVTGQHEKGKSVTRESNGTNSVAPRTDDGCGEGFADLLQTRVQLAILTGHMPLEGYADLEYQPWDDDQVRVRTAVRQLAHAFCLAAAELFPKAQDESKVLRVGVVTGENGKGHREKLFVDVTLNAPSEKTQTSWRMDSARLEAILGLWMWTLASDDRTKDNDVPHSKAGDTGMFRLSRIVSAALHTDGNDTAETLGDMDLWLDSSTIRFSRHALTLDKQGHDGLGTLLINAGIEDNRISLSVIPRDESNQTRRGGTLWRFCGWNIVSEALKSRATASGTSSQQPDEEIKLHLQVATLGFTETTLLDLCVHELFTALMMSLVGLIQLDEVTIVETEGKVRLQNSTVSIFLNAFVDSGLGTHSDALLAVIPPLRTQLRYPAPSDLLRSLTTAANTYRQKAEWERAETLLEWACARNDGALFVQALRAIGELYRWALSQHSDERTKLFGKTGVHMMVRTYANFLSDDGEVKAEARQIVDCYQEISRKTIDQSPGTPLGPESAGRELVKAIREGNRTDALYNLCFLAPGSFGSKDLQAALPLAARNRWSEVIHALLELKANPNGHDEQGRTAISHCAELGTKADLEYLLQHGASADITQIGGKSPLSWAAQNGHVDVAQLILNTGYIDINRLDSSCRSALAWAAENCREAMVKLLLDSGAAVDAGLQSCVTPLLLAAEHGHEEVAKLLLEKGADTEAKTDAGLTPLLLASRSQHVELVKLLLVKEAQKETQDDQGRTPLSLAAEYGHEEVVKVLLEWGADVEAKISSTKAPLLLAAQNGHENVVRLLLRKGADIEVKRWLSDGTPLSLATNNGHENVVRLLIQDGANIDAKGVLDQTPLSFAAENGHEDLVKLLLENGADKDAKDSSYGRTPLTWAARRGHEKAARVLLEYGADMKTQDKDGQSPLSSAEYFGKKGVVKLLREWESRHEGQISQQ